MRPAPKLPAPQDVKTRKKATTITERTSRPGTTTRPVSFYPGLGQSRLHPRPSDHWVSQSRWSSTAVRVAVRSASTRLTDEINDASQVRVLGGAQPLEQHHLSGDDLGAVALEAADRGLLVFGHARTDRVAH